MTRIWLAPSRPDPEAAAIVRLLAEAGETVVDLWDDGRLSNAIVIYAVGREDRPEWSASDARILAMDSYFERPREEFISGSRIGQVVAELARIGTLPISENGGQGFPAPPGVIFRWHDNGGTPRWCVQASWRGQRWAVYLPDEVVLAAASAYVSHCPGVDLEALGRFLASRANQKNYPSSDLTR